MTLDAASAFLMLRNLISRCATEEATLPQNRPPESDNDKFCSVNEHPVIKPFPEEDEDAELKITCFSFTKFLKLWDMCAKELVDEFYIGRVKKTQQNRPNLPFMTLCCLNHNENWSHHATIFPNRKGSGFEKRARKVISTKKPFLFLKFWARMLKKHLLYPMGKLSKTLRAHVTQSMFAFRRLIVARDYLLGAGNTLVERILFMNINMKQWLLQLATGTAILVFHHHQENVHDRAIF